MSYHPSSIHPSIHHPSIHPTQSTSPSENPLYYTDQQPPSLPLYYRRLKKYHLKHHFADYQNGFGVTSSFWDRVFNTELDLTPPPRMAKAE